MKLYKNSYCFFHLLFIAIFSRGPEIEIENKSGDKDVEAEDDDIWGEYNDEDQGDDWEKEDDGDEKNDAGKDN